MIFERIMNKMENLVNLAVSQPPKICYNKKERMIRVIQNRRGRGDGSRI